MYAINLPDTLLAMAAALFLLGAVSLVLGVFVLITRVMNREISTLTAQTAKLARKGITEDMSGLVSNASTLLTSMTQMVRTAAGIGIFLTSLGLGMMAAGYWMVLQISWPL
ncbi:MAG: hypothetical protein DWG76_01475 [Chloroflexi bacterium]|nr:hypothetical protein [Chloroflexota bacterium]